MCKYIMSPFIALLMSVVKQGSIQLVSDLDQVTTGVIIGSVQIYYNDHWGAIQDYAGWNINHARIVCRQLGYHFSATNSFTTCSRCGNIPCSHVLPVNIWKTEVACTGNEQFLTECSSTQNNWSLDRTCTTSYNTVGVRCAGIFVQKCACTICSFFVYLMIVTEWYCLCSYC